MNSRGPLSQWLIRYGLFVMAVAVVAVMYEPKGGQIGFNPAAKTALISGGICGGLSIIWGMLLRRGFRWAKAGALISTFLFFGAFTWRAIAGWMAYVGGQTEKWYASTLISCMWMGTAALLAALIRNRIASPHAPETTQPG